jgi:para-nitrobenzyl esterase
MEMDAGIIAETAAGKIEGTAERDLVVFRGIPFAAPPTGKRRWEPPEPRYAAQGILAAKAFGPAALQPPSKAGIIEEFTVKEAQSEDCLFLNIWTPGLDQQKRPVMVWIHGGYFTMGSGAQPVFRGDILASRGNTVVVTFNYRLGVFGFLRLKEVTEGEILSTGNEGLLDQIAVLEWVRDNIAAFGGDPGNVTVFGESAGALSIECLISMPRARGLFHKAILQSSISRAVRPAAEAVRAARVLIDVLGRRIDAESLRAVTAEGLLSAQIKASDRAFRGVMPAAPVIDGEVLPEQPLEAFKSGSIPDIPLLIGTNLEESQLFSALNGNPEITEETLIKRCRRILPDGDISAIFEAYKEARRKRGEPTSAASLYTAIQTDYMFRLPALRLAEAQSRKGRPVYNYLFTWRSPAGNGQYGACHGLEIGFIFGTYSADFGGTGPRAARLSGEMQDAWISFARNGDPACESLGDWPQYDERRTTMLLGSDSHLEVDPYGEERQAWENGKSFK